jgi:uncharacterized protein (TIGR03437 family)
MMRLRNGVFRSRRLGVGLAVSFLTVASLSLCGLGLTNWPGQPAWFTASALQPQVVVVNAASFASDGAIAPDTLATAFGTFNTQNNQSFSATGLPLPTTLGGVRLTINGVAASLFFVNPSQINFVVPSGLVDGQATIIVTNSDGSTRTGSVTIVRAAPGIFTARANGAGTPAGFATSNGTDLIPLANADFSPRELEPGTRERRVFLVLFGTGWRHTPAANPNDENGVAEAITATVQGVPATVVFAGAAPGLPGVDQINLVVPPELAGIGLVRLRVTAAGRLTNPTFVRIGGQPPPLRPQDLAAGQTINGALTPDDQLQLSGDGGGRLYFFDAYRLTTTAANTSIAVDLRSAAFDATVLLYRRNTDGTLTLLAADDETGGLGNGDLENSNALLLTILPTAGDYFIFATSSTEEPYGQGNYSLSLRTNVIQTISYGANITNASIATGDVQTSAGVLLDVYAFNGVAGDSAQIRMSSTAFDSFLILNTVAGESVTFDDNSGGIRDALMTSLLRQSGTYLIIATPFEPNRTGAYTLTLNKTNALAETDTDVLLAPAYTGRRLNTKLRLNQAEFEQYESRRIIN